MSDIEEFIVQEVEQEIINKVPSSDAVYNSLLKKAGLDESNTFTTANYFPDVDVDTVPETQTQLVVNVRSLRSYFSSIVERIVAALPNYTYIRRYNFLVASDVWSIYHGQNTDRITINIYQLGTNRRIVAPYRIIDNMSLQILFSTPEMGYVDIEFF
jgi:hypothetical protein